MFSNTLQLFIKHTYETLELFFWITLVIIIPLYLCFLFFKIIREQYRANLAVTRNLAKILESGSRNIDKRTDQMD